jgi:hypothetical protein
VCKTAKNLTDSTSDDPAVFTNIVTGSTATAFFDPPLDDEMQSDDDGMQSDSLDVASNEVLDTKIAKASGSSLVLEKGVNVSMLPTAPGISQTITVGSILVINGWRCAITDIASPGRSVDATALKDYDGSFSSRQNDEADGSASLSPLTMGKTVKIGAITCKIVGKWKSSDANKTVSGKPTPSDVLASTVATATPSLETTSSIASTASSTSTRATTSTLSSLGDLPVTKPASTSSTGRCVCDSSKRFACTSDNDCMLRFRNSTVVCYPTTECPTELGTGYCRLKSPDILEDELKPDV